MNFINHEEMEIKYDMKPLDIYTLGCPQVKKTDHI